MVHAWSLSKALCLAAIAAVPLIGGQAAVQPPETAAPAGITASPFIGAWELDVTRMPDTYGPPPKKVIYTFSGADAGQWQATIDITAPDGGVRHVALRYRLDGRAAESSGDTYEGHQAALHAPAPNVLVMGIARDKRPASVRTYVVSPNGQDMTEAAADVDPSGTPFVRLFHYKRAR
jgi:hypothetical protein